MNSKEVKTQPVALATLCVRVQWPPEQRTRMRTAPAGTGRSVRGESPVCGTALGRGHVSVPDASVTLRPGLGYSPDRLATRPNVSPSPVQVRESPEGQRWPSSLLTQHPRSSNTGGRGVRGSETAPKDTESRPRKPPQGERGQCELPARRRAGDRPSGNACVSGSRVGVCTARNDGTRSTGFRTRTRGLQELR